MTALIDHLTGRTSEPEAPVTTPRPFTPGVPWWAGVYGLDPVIPVDDWALAGQCTGMACAVYAFGADAGRAERWLPRKAAPATRFAAWLLDAPDWPGALMRRLALRLACEHRPDAPDADGIIQAAQDLHAACTPGMRPR